MSNKLARNLAKIESTGADKLLSCINRGLEKESLRVLQDGHLAQTPHPVALGSTLHHPSITTDYSESLLEFITPVHQDVESMLKFLEDLHVFTYQNMGDEILWTNSMPCILAGESSIPIADYGTSHVGMMKHVYRHGLSWRYGKLMQTIAGVHYNFSLPERFFELLDSTDSSENRSRHYFNLVRNFHRHCWLTLYLFGSAPAICKSFVEGREHNLEDFGSYSYALQTGTTLRMSDLGYQNNAQSSIQVCTDSVDQYVETLRAATELNWPEYEKIGIKVDGEYRQLNANILQIENEFYSVIRPKRTAYSGEKPTTALAKRGVEYIEVRSIDLDPYSPIGVTADVIRFMDAFLLFCMFDESPEISHKEQDEITANRTATVMYGRDAATKLNFNGEEINIRDAATELFAGIEMSARLLDKHSSHDHSTLVAREKEKINKPELTPSARILKEIGDNQEPYFNFAMRTAQHHKNYFDKQKLDDKVKQRLMSEATESISKTAELEAHEEGDFQSFLDAYFAG